MDTKREDCPLIGRSGHDIKACPCPTPRETSFSLSLLPRVRLTDTSPLGDGIAKDEVKNKVSGSRLALRLQLPNLVQYDVAAARL
jgi:hypothetical protein